jgi:hypothetical protein
MKKQINYIVVFTPESQGKAHINRIMSRDEVKELKENIYRNSVRPVFSINVSSGFTSETRKQVRTTKRKH